MKIAIIRFPGSNCDHDLLHALKFVLKYDAEYVWWGKRTLEGYDMAFVSGGFSFGDYLRAGSLATITPVVDGLKKFAGEGKPVIGICNGFQILTEAKLLPGALLHNASMKFICSDVYVKIESVNSRFTEKMIKGQILSIPISHMEGRYVADEATIKKLEDGDRVLMRYCNEYGEVGDGSNPNGSIGSIAGVISEKGNVAGLMPHPERVCESILGGDDGLKFFKSAIERVSG